MLVDRLDASVIHESEVCCNLKCVAASIKRPAPASLYSLKSLLQQLGYWFLKSPAVACIKVLPMITSPLEAGKYSSSRACSLGGWHK